LLRCLELEKFNKDAYRNAMVAQSTFVANCWVVPVHGITKQQMITLCPILLATHGVDSVKRTKSTTMNGRWDVLCKKVYFTTVKASVHCVLKSFDNTLPFPTMKTPFVWKKKWLKVHIVNNNSNREQSFMTTSAWLFASIVTDMDRENEMTNNRVLFDMAMLETPAAPSNSVIPSNTTGNNEVAQEMLALKAHIKAQDRKIARMEAMINQQAASKYCN
jgi:hypothetical protein